LGDLVFSYFQQTTDKTRIGAEVSTSIEKGTTDVEVGGDYKYDDTLLKVKMNSEGKLAGAFVQDVNKNTKFTVSAEVDVNRMTSTSVNDFRLGFRLDFNHEGN
jgi:hypothetical protein